MKGCYDDAGGPASHARRGRGGWVREKPKGSRYKQGYGIRCTALLPGPLSGELENMTERHELKLGPLVVRLALRGLMEDRRDGLLVTPQELEGAINETATLEPAGSPVTHGGLQ